MIALYARKGLAKKTNEVLNKVEDLKIKKIQRSMDCDCTLLKQRLAPTL